MHSPYAAVAVPTADPETDTYEEVGFRLLPPYNVLIENDEFHSCDFVVHVLREVFKFEPEKAFKVMLQAHEEGEAVCWTGSKEVAELKVEQIETFHEKQMKTGKDLGPLGCRIEPAE